MNTENRSFLLAILLSIAVLVGWNAFIAAPRIEAEQERLKREELAKKKNADTKAPKVPGTTPATTDIPGVAPGQPPLPASDATTGTPSVATAAPTLTREAALKATKRIAIKTPALQGSVNLTGGRIDDLTLVRYRETTANDSPPITLFSPSNSARPYYAEHGWVEPGKVSVGAKTVWTAETNGPLTASNPVTLKYDNGNGLVFRRTISVDDNYLFTVRQEVENTTSAPVTLFPYALISRHGEPKTEGIYILHEGLIGVFQEEGLTELDYGDVLDAKQITYESKTGWLGITDKYWAATLIPAQDRKFTAHLKGNETAGKKYFQADYSMEGVVVPAGGKQFVEGRVFAGAKKANLINTYEEQIGVDKFDKMIDWGWFHFITKPLYALLTWLQSLVGNYGIAILLTTVLIKLVFFPLANKSYVSMGKMKKLQPEMERIRERFGDDRARQQQAMMELYKKEKINPMSGCLPILLQIPVFFALYKVLYVSIEMRHAPFFGWITDLSAPDPTSIFNLFGLIPISLPGFLLIGVWPILMGISMWVQMKLNPAPTDPMQEKIFTWMPVFFTFLLATFPAGLVIYWTWNNILSVAQQWFIMSRQGVKVELFDNIEKSFGWLIRKKETDKS